MAAPHERPLSAPHAFQAKATAPVVDMPGRAWRPSLVWQQQYRLLALALITLASCLLAWLLVHVWQTGRMDNGDGWRVLRRAFVFNSTSWQLQPLQQAYEMAELTRESLLQALPKASSGLLVFAIALGSKALGLSAFPVWPMSACYLALYLTGAACWVRGAPGVRSKVLVALVFASFLLNPYLLAIFNSFYEEAATFALLPPWAWLAFKAFHSPPDARCGRFYLASAAMLFSKTQMLPVLLPVLLLHTAGRKRVRGPVILLLVVSGFMVAKGMHQHEEYNAFNRLNNGLAYSLADVSNWGAREHEGRQAQAHQRVNPASAQALGLPDAVVGFWGASYWPEAEQRPGPQRVLASEAGRLPNYVQLVLAHPTVIGQLLMQPYLTAVRADYRMDYLFMHAGKAGPSSQLPIWDGLMQKLGWLYVLVWPVLALACWRRDLLAASLCAIVIISPSFVVLGDGYYEFEKHLLPYLALSLGALASLAVGSKQSGPRHQTGEAPTAQPSVAGQADGPPSLAA